MKENFFIKMLTANSGLSCKRVCGFLGWIVCLIIASYCAISGHTAPLLADTIIFGAIALLGVDSVTSIWRKPPTSPPQNQTPNE